MTLLRTMITTTTTIVTIMVSPPVDIKTGTKTLPTDIVEVAVTLAAPRNVCYQVKPVPMLSS